MGKILRPDVCVVGAGSGGLTVAAACAALGVPVVLVEKGAMGGDCLNYGCVPSKALLAAGRRAQAMREAGAFGIAPVEPEVDFRKAMRRVHAVIANIAPNDSAERFTAMGVRVVRAEGRFKDRRGLIAGDLEIRARRFVVATGSSPALPDIPGIDTVPHLTNETVFGRTRLPSHLIVVGGGAVGIELAQAHARLGSAVTVLEAGPSILAAEDREATAILVERLGLENIDIRTSCRIGSVEPHGRSGVRVRVDVDGAATTIDGTHLLVATGRKANVDGLGLDAAGIRHTAAGIAVSKALRTSNRRVYAIGDVVGAPQFTHVANYHAGLVVRALLFRLPVDRTQAVIPRVTYTEPALAHVGMGEAEARRAAGRHLRILRWPFAENDRAQADETQQGFVKLLVGRRGKLLGVTILGAEAGELIGLWSLALARKMGVRDMLAYIAPYPTLGESGKRAALTYFKDTADKRSVRRLVRLLRLFG